MVTIRNSDKSLRTRAAIMEAAQALFRERGFEAATIREIAERASIAVGATYYHFRTKDEVVWALYEATVDAFEERASATSKITTQFPLRIRDLLEFKLTQLAPLRDFLGHVACHALLPRSPLSPFSQESTQVRERELAIFNHIVEGSTLKVAPEFKPHLARLLWLYYMAVVSFWLNDTSHDQGKTRKLITVSISLIVKLFAVTRVPILRQANGLILSLLQLSEAPQRPHHELAA